jgi:HD-GYP domain-containing protein (c-di-GMP phosphodiesterase class II)
MRLKNSAAEIRNAYEMTLEGWAKALEYRDRETEGHSRRVVDLSVHLADSMGCRENEIVHIRRGALLHDIGKIAIPDAILLKPGPLDEREWGVMKQHPVFAREMLSPIKFLQPAMDIPYYHHERWDGQGYPENLHGQDIPLPARIFAVVDNWEALNSDRPYRKAWSGEQVRSYIGENAGIKFDPHVVRKFLQII